jgi:hypothetical protein
MFGVELPDMPDTHEYSFVWHVAFVLIAKCALCIKAEL